MPMDTMRLVIHTTDGKATEPVVNITRVQAYGCHMCSYSNHTTFEPELI